MPYERLRDRLIEHLVRRGHPRQKAIDLVYKVTDKQLYQLMENSRKKWESCGYER